MFRTEAQRASACNTFIIPHVFQNTLCLVAPAEHGLKRTALLALETFLAIFAFLLLSTNSWSAVYQENFEGQFVSSSYGSIPTGWATEGSTRVSYSKSSDHYTGDYSLRADVSYDSQYYAVLQKTFSGLTPGDIVSLSVKVRCTTSSTAEGGLFVTFGGTNKIATLIWYSDSSSGEWRTADLTDIVVPSNGQLSVGMRMYNSYGTSTFCWDDLTISTGLTLGGSLKVTINPQEASAAGARWRRVGTEGWFNGGATETEVVPGSYTVEFSDVPGWTKPQSQGVTIVSGQTANITGIYFNPKTYYDTVQKCYVGYYQRPADPGGLVWWAERLSESGGNLNSIIEAFAKSDESKALYGEVNNETISSVVNGIYMGLFSRTASREESDYWSRLFKEGKISSAGIMLIMLNGAQNEDLVTINNKLAAANLFTNAIDPELDGKNFLYDYSADVAQRARNFLSNVTSDPSTIPTTASITAFFLQTSTSYTYTILSNLGLTNVHPWAISNNGKIAGWGLDDSEQALVFVYSNGSATVWTYEGLTDAYATGINSSGQVVGYGYNESGQLVGFVHTDDVFSTLLPSGWIGAEAAAINDKNQIVGLGVNASKKSQAFLYSNGTFKVLSPSGWAETAAWAINNSSQIVGDGLNASGQRRCFLYVNGTYKALLPAGWMESYVVSINDNGQVVGYGLDGTGQQRGFLYTGGSYVTLLPEGWTNAWVTGINDNGQVVGYGLDGTGQQRGFLYTGGSYVTLLPEGWAESVIHAINDNGQVVGQGKDTEGKNGGFYGEP